jgi:PadR family transcriptional regulator, regulatory protein PadR
VLRALAVRPSEWRHGYDLCLELGIKSGSLYPILMRLADRRLLEATWETDHAPGRPPRHLYRLSPSGLSEAAELAQLADQSRRRLVELRGIS